VTTDDASHTYAPTYSAVYDEVLQPTCGVEFCHGGSSDYFEVFSVAGAYASLVNAPAQGPLCKPTGLKRVDPGHPETSLVYLKLTHPPCGARMPYNQGCSGGLDPRSIEQIREWIACGALDGDGGCPEGAADASDGGTEAGILDAIADSVASDGAVTE
jgi:hypothetical protein